mmetsp:Transcript_26901/g.67475  ORF Transcript_26901/g.67475 Transcript_26901/m.67475 type:complete len:246 (-) Transcript_26901:295-1032(-)
MLAGVDRARVWRKMARDGESHEGSGAGAPFFWGNLKKVCHPKYLNIICFRLAVTRKQEKPILIENSDNAASLSEIYAGLTTMSRSSLATRSPMLIGILVTSPSMGLATTVSIFMALSTAKGSPALTTCPSLTLIPATVPGMLAPTCPATEGSAFSAVLMFLDLALSLSRTLMTRGTPLRRKRTSRMPASSTLSEIDKSLIIRVLPASMSMLNSSPTSMGWRKAPVGISWTASEYLSRQPPLEHRN